MFDTPPFFASLCIMPSVNIRGVRILLIHNIYRQPGGEETCFYSLVKLLKSKGHKVLTWTKDNKNINEAGLLNKIKIAIGMFWNRDTERELSGVIEEFEPDIAHFNNIFPLITPTAYYVCRKFGVPIVQTIHNYRFMFPKSVFFRRGKMCPYCLDERFVYLAFLHKCYDQPLAYTFIFSVSHMLHRLIRSFNFVDLYIFPSQFAKKYYLDNSNIKKDKTRVIANFVDIRPNRSKPANKKGHFLYVGRFSEEKGVLELLETFSLLPKLKLTAIGEGSLKRKLIKFKKCKNISIINFLPREKVLDYINKALFTVIPSKCYEVMPMILAESFASGTAVIVPKIGVFKEIVAEGKTGIVYEPDNCKALSATLKKASKNKAFARKMGSQAQKEYIEKYNPDIFYFKLINEYKRLTKSKT